MRTDLRSIELLEVRLEGEHVANLARTAKGCRFSYTSAFLSSPAEPIARNLPKSENGIAVEGMANLPTFFAGLLPEGVMMEAVVRLARIGRDDLFALLAATGQDAIGDVSVRIPGEPVGCAELTLEEAVESIAKLLGRGGEYGAIAAIPGVQPKLSLGQLVRASRSKRYIAKFEPAEFPGLLQNEHACMRLAAHAGLPSAATELRSRALVVQRFDRVFDSATRRLRHRHVEDALQVMDLYPHSKYAVGYAEILRVASQLGVSKAGILGLLRLYAFSYLIANGDLHAKNVSFLYDREAGQWTLSPAYDLVSTLPYAGLLTGADRMALPLDDDSYGRFSVADFVVAGESFGLPAKATEGMLTRLVASVQKGLSGLAEMLPPDTLDVIRERCRLLCRIC